MGRALEVIHMAEQATAMQTRKETTPALLKLTTPTDLFKQVEDLYNSITRRAFEIFENNGRVFGHDLEDWFQAESELLHPIHIDIAESNEGLTVRAEVPGFKADDLQVSLEGNRLTITGKRETREERKDEKTIYKERCSDRILRVIDLPAEVDAGKAVATLKDGLLELKAPKTPPAKSIPIKTKAA
jgi:HSP20 family protein